MPNTTVDYRRQHRLFDPREHGDVPITIVGVGNTGSHAAHALVRMGMRHITLYDPDTIEAHNLASQLYDAGDVGQTKVHVMAQRLRAMNPDIQVEAIAERFTGGMSHRDILIVCVDSIASRREILTKLPAIPARWVVDCRVGGEQIEVYPCVNPHIWETTLPDRAGQDPCGAQFIAYVSIIAGGLIAMTVRRILNSQQVQPFMFHLGSLTLMKLPA